MNLKTLPTVVVVLFELHLYPTYMKIPFTDLLVKPATQKKLKSRKTKLKTPLGSDENISLRLIDVQKKIAELQNRLYANRTQALLIIVQGMDAAGKDSIINSLLHGLHPNGFNVVQFKTPSEEVLKHDFMWRSHCNFPERGQITVFNRSYYEEVLFPQVHNEALVKEKITLPKTSKQKKKFWNRRLKDIVHHEAYLNREGTLILKFFLHISKDEQKKRLLRRIEDPTKNWKFDSQDIQERKLWSAYHKIYGWCFRNSSTAEAPWYIIPADHKPTAKLVIAEILLQTLQELNLTYPYLSPRQKLKLQASADELRREK